jgi:predicted ester cyclase
MKMFRTSIVSLALLLGSFMSNVMADDKATVQTFYDFLSNPASQQHADAFKASTTESWQSIGDYSGKNKNRDQFIGQVSGFFAKLMPDLNWEVQEMILADDKVVVRSRASGTPNGPLFGVDGQGKSFDILTIDVHTLKDGKIISSYHLEDWAGALQQLSGK